MKTQFANFVEGIASYAGSVFRTSMPSYCQIETADSDISLVTAQGTLVSGLRLNGFNFPIGPDEFEEVTSAITRTLQSFLSNSGHSVDFFATVDPSKIRRKLSVLSDGVRKTCDRIGLQMDDVITSNENALAKLTADEALYLVLWTRKSVISKNEIGTEQKEIMERLADLPLTAKSAQPYFSALSSVREKHEATIGSILEDLKNSGVVCEMLTSREMLRIARMEIDPEFTPSDWNPQLVGDRIPVVQSPGILRNQNKRNLDYSDMQYPPISWQLFPRDAQRINSKYVSVGERAFAPVFVEIPPREITPFSVLFDKLKTAKLPWRCLIRIDGGGLAYTSIKAAFAPLLSLTSSSNSKIAEAIKALRDVEFEGNTVTRFRMSFCTWAPADNLKLLAARSSRLAQIVSAWGQCEVREVSGDPLFGMISTVPFITEESAANASVAPLAHLTRMLPLRPSSPWASGSIVLRTLDGRVIPFQPGSSLQSTWNYIFFGRPGFGKSVQMLNLILSSCMQPGLSRLPQVGIVDIGPSSQYFVNMIRESLPKNLRHLVGGYKLTMSAEHAINPFDTPLGCRHPTPEHKAFIVNILSQIATPAEMDKGYSRMSELISKVIDDVYEMYSVEGAKSTPKRYSIGTLPEVDEILSRTNYMYDSNTAWWHIVDFLAGAGETHAATLAQRYAVPTISDCVALSSQVVDVFGRITVDTGETLPEAFSSLISSATRDFPNLSSQTQFDIGEVRIAAINLEEVAKSGSRSAVRQTAIMYMLASYALTKDYRLSPDSVPSMRMPDQYRAYHMKRARETKEELKWIAYDEFHRTSSSEAVQASVMVDMREGRKFNIGVILSSQGAEDFPPAMREFATGTFIVDAGSDNNARSLQKFFGFNDTARNLLTQKVLGPTAAGVPMLVSLTTKKGVFTQVLVSTLGQATRWALSTTAEDVLVREIVCSRLGAVEGRSALVALYPNGVQEANERLKEAGVSDSIAQIAKEIIDFRVAR